MLDDMCHPSAISCTARAYLELRHPDKSLQYLLKSLDCLVTKSNYDYDLDSVYLIVKLLLQHGDINNALNILIQTINPYHIPRIQAHHLIESYSNLTKYGKSSLNLLRGVDFKKFNLFQPNLRFNSTALDLGLEVILAELYPISVSYFTQIEIVHMLLLLKGEVKLSLKYARELVQLYPKASLGYVLYGRSYYRFRDQLIPNDALGFMYKIALELSLPYDSGIKLEYANLCLQLGNIDHAMGLLNNVRYLKQDMSNQYCTHG
jgi:hypothetical protein